MPTLLSDKSHPVLKWIPILCQLHFETSHKDTFYTTMDPHTMPTLLSDQSQGYTLHHNGSPYCANSTIRPVTEIHPKLQWIPIPCQLHYKINHRYIPCPGEAKMSTSRLSLMTKALPPPCTMLWGCGHNRFSFSSVTTGLRGLHAAMSRSNVASF